MVAYFISPVKASKFILPPPTRLIIIIKIWNYIDFFFFLTSLFISNFTVLENKWKDLASTMPYVNVHYSVHSYPVLWKKIFEAFLSYMDPPAFYHQIRFIWISFNFHGLWMFKGQRIIIWTNFNPAYLFFKTSIYNQINFNGNEFFNYVPEYCPW